MEEREERLQRLKRLKRKRMYTMLSLCAVLCLLVGGYYVLTQQNKKKAEEERKKAEQNALLAQETEITEFLVKDVAEIEFSNADAVYHFAWEDEGNYGNWIKQDEKDFPTDAAKVQTIINAFCGLTGTSKMNLADIDPADYGLENTKYGAKLTLTDGTVHQFYLGNEAPYETGYYLLHENTGEVFVVAQNVYTQLATKKIKLVLAETFPSAEPESMTELRIEVRGNEPVSYVPEQKEDGSMEYPPIFYDNMRFVASTVQEYNCTDFAKYGLDDPFITVTIEYLGYEFDETGNLIRQPSTMVAEIGDQTVSDNYYVRVNGSDFVYIMMQAHAEKYLSY